MNINAESARRRRLRKRYNMEVKNMIRKYEYLNSHAENIIYKITPDGLIPIEEYNNLVKGDVKNDTQSS